MPKLVKHNSNNSSLSLFVYKMRIRHKTLNYKNGKWMSFGVTDDHDYYKSPECCNAPKPLVNVREPGV